MRAVLNRALSRSEHNVDFEFCSKQFLTQLCFEYPSKRSCVILAVRPVEQARSLAVLFCCSLACCTLVSFALLLVQRVMWVAHVLNGIHDSALMFDRDPITIVRRHLQLVAVRLHRSHYDAASVLGSPRWLQYAIACIKLWVRTREHDFKATQ